MVVPGGADDGQIEVRVIGGKDQDVETCKAPSYGPAPPSPTGCVVARRLLSFEPHYPLYLPIVLRDVCVGIPCDSGATCVEGTCVDATVKDPGKCTNLTACGESSLVPPDGGAPDVGPPDAGPDDGGLDAGPE